MPSSGQGGPAFDHDDKKDCQKHETGGEADPTEKENRQRHGEPAGEGATGAAPATLDSFTLLSRRRQVQNRLVAGKQQ